MMLNSEVLVLNSGFIPIRITSVREAICLLTADKAIPLVEVDNYIRSPSVSIKIPTVISVTNYSGLHKKRVTLSKLNVIYRDDMKCQYCGIRYSIKDLTVDHIIPRSRWEQITGRQLKDGYVSWTNLVCSCKWCNNKKGNRLINEMKWKLIREPFEPQYIPYLIISLEKAKRKGWLPYCSINVRLIEIIH